MAQLTMSDYRALSAATSKHVNKRQDIQGLRALAVLIVVADHLLGWPSGGFVGVDVFFVISGFLITGLLQRELQRTGKISFANFYKRRARRIMPAAVSVLIVTSAAAYLLFSEARTRETLADAVWSLFFAANWHFSAVGTDYFLATGPTSPLQHFWSLAVEEQFYVVWPCVMLLIFAVGGRIVSWNEGSARKAVGFVMAVIVILSFAWAYYQSATSPTAAYFSTFTRGWELGVGALVAVSEPVLRRIADVLRPFIAWAGLGGIIWSTFYISAELAFPAPWAAVPVLSTALVIVAGTGGKQRLLGLLTNRVTGYIGNVSYSLYLWHFPVIIFAAALMPERTPEFYWAALIAMFFLTAASFHLVEEPCRKFSWSHPKKRKSRGWRSLATHDHTKEIGLVVLSVITIGVVSAALMGISPYGAAANSSKLTAKAPLLERPSVANTPAADTSVEGEHAVKIAAALGASDFPEFVPPIESLGTDAWSKRAEISCMNVSSGNVDRCLTGPLDASKTAVVLGDSFAVAWLPGLRAALEPLGYNIQALTMGQCPAAKVSVTLEGGAAFPACEAHLRWAVDRVATMKPELTILASSQDSTMRRLTSGKTGQDAVAEIVAGLEDTVAAVSGNTGRIAVLSSPPAGKNMQACVTKFASPRSCTTELSSDWRALSTAEAKVSTAAVSYVNTVSWFCNDEGYCPGFVGNTPVRVDTGHITVEYSQLLAPLLSKALDL